MLKIGKRIGIDLGRHRVKVAVQGKGIVLREVPAVAIQNGQVIAVGNDVIEMEKELGIAEYRKQGIQTLNPFDTLTADAEKSEKYFADFIKNLVFRVSGKLPILKPVIALTFKEDNNVDISGKIIELSKHSGAKAIHFVQNASANLLGLGNEIDNHKEYLVVDIGYQSTDATYVKGEQPAKHYVDFGGKKLDDIVSRWIKDKHNLPVNEAVAEDIKLRILVRAEREGRDEIFVDLGGNTMKVVNVSEIRAEFYKAYRAVVSDVKKFYSPLEAETRREKQGLVLAGEGARIPELVKLFQEEFGLTPLSLNRPADTAALGIIKMFEYNNI